MKIWLIHEATQRSEHMLITQKMLLTRLSTMIDKDTYALNIEEIVDCSK